MNTYIGEWRDDKMHGHFTITNHIMGSEFIGEYRNGKKNGQGTFTWGSGEKYVGEYRDGKRHGQGTYTYGEGLIEKGIWENGEFVEDVVTYAMDRCFVENFDKIAWSNDTAERALIKKCQKDLRDLSISELREAYN